MIGNPPLNSALPVSGNLSLWPKPWGNWLTALSLNIFGWTKTYTGSKTHDFGSIASLATDTTTVTITGAVSGDMVSVTSGTPTTGIIVDGYVSAVDTVTIRAMNFTGAGVDPASSTFRVIVFQQ